VSLAHPAQQRRYVVFWWWPKDKVKLNQIRNGGCGQDENIAMSSGQSSGAFLAGRAIRCSVLTLDMLLDEL